MNKQRERGQNSLCGEISRPKAGSLAAEERMIGIQRRKRPPAAKELSQQCRLASKTVEERELY